MLAYDGVSREAVENNLLELNLEMRAEELSVETEHRELRRSERPSRLETHMIR